MSGLLMVNVAILMMIMMMMMMMMMMMNHNIIQCVLALDSYFDQMFTK